MYVERLLQINMAALACLGTLLLGMGQQNPAAPLGMLIAAMLAVWITDFKGWFCLSKRAADWAALAAFVLCLPAAMRLEKIALISAVAHLLVLCQAIQLFRKKEVPVYWHLMRFSLLQVVVAALLIQDIVFGLLLVVYLFTALEAMTLLFLHSERVRYHHRMEPEPTPVATAARWPLAHRPACFWGPPTGRTPLGRGLFVQILRIGFATLLISALVFVVVPRFGLGAFRGFGGAIRSAVGFSDRVRLGELGRVIQNPQEVLRIRLTDRQTGAPYAVEGGVYLRGAVLTEYASDGRRAAWLPPSQPADLREVYEGSAEQQVREAPVQQSITIEPLDRPELFCVWPFTFLRPDNRLLYVPWAYRLFRAPLFQNRQFQYELGTTAFWNHEQARVVPNEESTDITGLLQMPSEGGRTVVPGLVALAQQWIEESKIPASHPMGRATNLERRLRESGRFQYTLQGQPRDPRLDPIEDFITKNPRGHCEYFATALCLMLRSQGIPARVVVGYYTTEYNRLGQYFQVRQLHAHTWVEAYLAPSQIPAEVLRQRPSWQWLSGAWLRLDPTPAATPSASPLSLLARMGGLFGQLNFAWTNYVVEMDRPRQRLVVYRPIADAVRTALQTLTDPAWWESLVRGLGSAVGLAGPGRTGFSWRIGVAILVTVGLSLLGWHVVGAWWAKGRGRWGAGRKAARSQAASQVEFYRRFERLVARRGLRRPPSQTQREFVRDAARQLANQTGDRQWPPLLEGLVEAFYRVRFGALALDATQAAAVQQTLTRLEKLLAKRQPSEGSGP